MCVQPKTIKYAIGNRSQRKVGCGVCVECLAQRAREWSFRIIMEAKLYEKNCFLTLTYNDDMIPYDESLSKRDLQLFIKRLRKKLFPQKIRFFACGEYGSKKGRPHYHLVIFGYVPTDLKYFKTIDNVPYYTSEEIFSLWGQKSKRGFLTYGFHLVSDTLTLDNAKYCAKYMQKLNVEENQGKVKSYVVMSNRPGIGAAAFDFNSLDSDKIYYRGQSIRIPRYFLKLSEREGLVLDDLKQNRLDFYDLKEKSFVLSAQEVKKLRQKKFLKGD